MERTDIFSIEFPQNEKLRECLSLKRLADIYTNSKQFDKTAALAAAAHFKINARIKQKIQSNPEYLVTWERTCTYIFTYLMGPAKFFDRTDANELVCLPLTTKVILDNKIQTLRGISIYNSTKWIGTLFFKDPEFNNEFAFYGQNDFVSTGSWGSKVRADVQKYNLYGLTKVAVSTDVAAAKSILSESVSVVGNTITVKDIFSSIDNLKKTFTGINL